jgi:hypothetical protein
MGIFDKLFGGSKEYPPLPEDNEAQARIKEVKAQLEELAGRVPDPIEVVPAEKEAFVFLGKPPKRFGIAWIHEGKVSSLKELAEENKLSQIEVGKLINKLGQAYEHAGEVPRYSAAIGGKRAVVIPSDGLAQEVRELIRSVVH